MFPLSIFHRLKWRSLLGTLLVLCVLYPVNPVDPVHSVEKSSGSYAHYLPLVSLAPLPVQAEVTARGELIGYPTYYYVYGYVNSLVSEPLYSVTVDVDVTIYPYEPEGESVLEPYTQTISVTPALSATLPSQNNPFTYGLLLGKASASIGDVRAASASYTSPDGYRYHSLNITNWEYVDGVISGIARNESSAALSHIRVVVADLEKCRWREATPEESTLAPGQETTFQMILPEACFGDQLIIVGQGAAAP
jgi:hypothetical protein